MEFNCGVTVNNVVPRNGPLCALIKVTPLATAVTNPVEECCTTLIMSPFVLVRNVPITLKTSAKGGLVGKDRDESKGVGTSGSDGASQQWRSQAGGCGAAVAT